ncbi:MAG: DUF4054 domain-containing protein [Nostoc sp. NMS7]|uniref:DUF4054 domain-containing protein n=1 Tax=Nostoc sp. NMS7 TaxID=2815391 RepID=UPI0025CBD51B|nr:DUF4054 domain-containing protein [Nostoc sp. NMS7]MBN3946456.1 DUF4054 domain-containing protein [Nostoc sp. NMS7]
MLLSPTTDYFLAHGYNRFAIVEPLTIQFWLDTSALSFVPASLWGIHRVTGIMLCAAHFIEMEWLQTAQTSGSATSIAAGGGGGSLAAQQDDFQLTTWGRRFSFLRNGLINGSISPLADETFAGLPTFGIGFVI